MSTHYFWDIENVSFHNLEKIMNHIENEKNDVHCHVVFAKIKEARKEVLITNGWELIKAEQIGNNSADFKIKEMIESLLSKENNNLKKIVLITEDKGFKKTGKKIIDAGCDFDIITATKNPDWITELNNYKKSLKEKARPS